MSYKRYKPLEIYKDLIQFFWEYEEDFSDGISYKQPTTASINPKLAFQYTGKMDMKSKSGRSEQLFLSGFQAQTDTPNTIYTNQRVGVFGVYFYPLAIPVLFGIPSNEITNCNIEISDLMGSEGRVLEEKIMLCNSTSERINKMNEFFESKFKSFSSEAHLLIYAINHIINKSGLINLHLLASEMCLSPKQVERKFYKYTGFGPKQFSRIVRFEQSIASVYKGVDSLTSLAHQLGFYDQSHFIKNFKEFSGKTPKEYFSNDLSFLLGL